MTPWPGLSCPGCGKKDVGARDTAGPGICRSWAVTAEPRRSQNGHRPGARNFRSLKVFLATADEAQRTPCPGLKHRKKSPIGVPAAIRSRGLNEVHIIGIMLLSSECWQTTSRTEH